jgi:hypothetical protein
MQLVNVIFKNRKNTAMDNHEERMEFKLHLQAFYFTTDDIMYLRSYLQYRSAVGDQLRKVSYFLPGGILLLLIS